MKDLKTALLLWHYHQNIDIALRTSNIIERENREIRRREKVIQIFPNTESIIRLIGAVLQDDHNEWSVGHKSLI